MSVADIVGLIGVGAYVLAYAMLQLGKLDVADLRYALLNALGAVLILYSLLFNFNLPSFVTQTVWLALTVIGYARSRGRKVAPAS